MLDSTSPQATHTQGWNEAVVVTVAWGTLKMPLVCQFCWDENEFDSDQYSYTTDSRPYRNKAPSPAQILIHLT